MKKPPTEGNQAGKRDDLLRKLFKGMGKMMPGNPNQAKPIDTFKSLRNLKAMLKNGQISEDEYEALKIELLRR